MHPINHLFLASYSSAASQAQKIILYLYPWSSEVKEKTNYEVAIRTYSSHYLKLHVPYKTSYGRRENLSCTETISGTVRCLQTFWLFAFNKRIYTQVGCVHFICIFC